MNNLVKILIIVLSLASCLGLSYYYGSENRGLKDNITALNLTIEQNQNKISQLTLMNVRLQTQNIINDAMVTQAESQLDNLQTKYISLQKDNDYVKTKLNNSNRINLLWVQYVQSILTPTGMPALPYSASNLNAATIYVNPSDTADRIRDQLYVCRQDIIRYSALQDWITLTENNYESK